MASPDPLEHESMSTGSLRHYSPLVQAVYRAAEGELILCYADGRCCVHADVPPALAAGLLSTSSPALYVQQHLVGVFGVREVAAHAVEALLGAEAASSAKGFVISFESDPSAPRNGHANSH